MNSLPNHPWPYLATAAFAALVGLYTWKQPRRPGTRYFGWMLGPWLVWALAAGFQTVVQPLKLRYGLWAVQGVAALLTNSLQLAVILEYTGNEKWLARRNLVLLALPALIPTLMVFTLPSNTLASIEYRSGIDVIVGRDPLAWGFFSADPAWPCGAGTGSGGPGAGGPSPGLEFSMSRRWMSTTKSSTALRAGAERT